MANVIMHQRNQMMLVKKEDSYGVFPVVDGSNLIEFNEIGVESVHDKEQLERLRGFLGNQGAITAATYVKVMAKAYLVGSGTAGTPPAWGELMLAAANAEVSDIDSVEYTPVSTNLDSVSAAWRSGSVEQRLTGMRGDIALEFVIGKAPTLTFEGFALYNDPTADVAVPSGLVFANIIPESVQAHTVTTMSFFGQSVAMQSVSAKLGNQFGHVELTGHEEVEMDDRSGTLSVKFRCTEDEFVYFLAKSKNNEFGDIDILHGLADAKKVGFKANQIQMTSVPKLVWDQGKSYLQVDCGTVPAAPDTDYEIYLPE